MSEQQIIDRLFSGELENSRPQTKPQQHNFKIDPDIKEWLDSLSKPQVKDLNERLRTFMRFWMQKTQT
jgi:hypothetical protein